MSPKNTLGQSMILITSSFRNEKTFALIPATLECPYVECLFDPQSKILACITKTLKGSYHMVPKLDDNGDPARLKVARRESGKTIKEQRVMVDTFSEFYVSEEKEIVNFINTFAVNASEFKFKPFLKPAPEKPEIIMQEPLAKV